MAVHEDVLRPLFLDTTAPGAPTGRERALGEALSGLFLPDAAAFAAEMARRPFATDEERRRALVAEAASRVSALAPDWQFAAARLMLDDLYRQAAAHRPAHAPGYGDLYAFVRHLTERGLYDERLMEGYTRLEFDALASRLVPERDRLFTYAGLRHLADRYLVRGWEGEALELPQEAFMGVAMTLALAEPEGDRVAWAARFYDTLSLLRVTLATPTLRNARRPFGQLSSCFVDTPEDSLRGIFNGLGAFADVSKHGGGMGVYLGKLRASRSAIQGVPGAAGGVIPWVRLYNDTAVSVDQLGQRAGAVSLWLDIWHRDIVDFLELKTNSGDERRKAYDVFPGVCVPDLFYRTLEQGGDWHLFDPHEVRARLGFSLEDSHGPEFERRYRACVEHPDLTRDTLPALDLMALVLKSAYETGGPFLFHRDTANRLNPNGHAGMVYCSNLCTEIVQNQSPTVEIESVLADGEVRTRRRPGDFVVCNLGSVNLGRARTLDDLADVVPTLVRMLDDAIAVNRLPLPEATRTNERYRAIGLGTSGYHEHLVRQGIAWQSERHVAYADALYEEINRLAIQASAALARERGPYPLFPGSDWQTGAYFAKRGYTDARWQALQAEVARSGLRNGYLLAVAPTGSTSVIAGTTAAVDPVFRRVFTEEKRGLIVRQVAPGLDATTWDLYAPAHSIDQRWSVRAAAARQRHIDQSQSVNLYATADLDEQRFLALYLEAWRAGLKTVYYFRNFDGEPEAGAEACAACTA
jgi:ribonucleoside-diphosphate reductase alpha chain